MNYMTRTVKTEKKLIQTSLLPSNFSYREASKLHGGGAGFIPTQKNGGGGGGGGKGLAILIMQGEKVSNPKDYIPLGVVFAL